MAVRWMSAAEAHKFLASGTEGRLATCNADGQPYITPVNYVCHNEKIYFHCAKAGHKLDNIAANPLVCFEVSGDVRTTAASGRPCDCSTRYSSVLVFGRGRLVAGESEKAVLLNRLVAHLANGKPFQPVTEQQAVTCAVVEVKVEKISGKINYEPASRG
jgi:uncharacterized protein